jgi:hypothetical protein
MAWRVANSLLKLRGQVDDAVPDRAKGSDGTIGDPAHQSRTSDHNAWVKDGAMGVVTALDLTHDPAHGVDSYKLAETLRGSKDKRIKYIISNKRIWTPSIASAWRPYTGTNGHTMHVHISVHQQKSLYDDTTPWRIGELEPVIGAPIVRDKPVLKRGASSPDVTYLQTLLNFPVSAADGKFGPMTQAAVIEFQRTNGLVADGVVGAYTWAALIERGKRSEGTTS